MDVSEHDIRTIISVVADSELHCKTLLGDLSVHDRSQGCDFAL